MTAVPEAQLARPWVCKAGVDDCTRTAPCRSCLGRRNRRAGQVKQRKAAKALGVQARYRGEAAQEEAWRGAVRWEVKSGRQAHASAPALYLRAEAQSREALAIGDVREFGLVLMPLGWEDGLVVVRLSKLSQVAAALLGEGA